MRSCQLSQPGDVIGIEGLSALEGSMGEVHEFAKIKTPISQPLSIGCVRVDRNNPVSKCKARNQ